MALKGLIVKTAIDPKIVDYLYYGTVIQESKTSNIAREAGLGAGIPVSVPSHTVTQACISANQAITTGAEKILSGGADIVRFLYSKL
jgi:acetyl-CoA acetyltransferase